MVLSDDFYYQPIRLDTINTQIYTDLIAKEGDAGGRGLKVTITENGVTKNTTGITLNLKWEHTAVADLQGLEPFEAVDLTKGIYKLKYPTNMLHKGTVKALIQIIDNGGLAGSRNLKIKVDSTVGDDTAMESSNEFTALVTALVKTNHMENLLNETIANVTVDSEVITARNSTAKQKTFTVLDERMEDLEKDVYYPANNELTQADFAATTGWSVYQGTLAVANNVASVTGTSGLYPNVYQDINCEVGDKLYYAAQARVTTAGAAAIALRSEGVEITTDNARVLTPAANQWYQLDCIKTAFETTPSFAVSQRYALAADATGKVLQVKKPIALNLTKIFGANAIPTIEQIRAILSRFTDSHFVGNEGLSQPALLMGKALSLEAQFNAAVAGLTVDDETINARVGKDNTTHATLKARLDSEKSTIDQSLLSLGSQLADKAEYSGLINTNLVAENNGTSEQTVITDYFNRPNSINVLGKNWEQMLGTWGIVDGQAYVSTTVGLNRAVIDSQSGDGEIEVILTKNEGLPRLIFRSSDANNEWVFYADSANTQYVLAKRVAGAITSKGSYPGTPLDNAKIKVKFNGSSIKCYLNGTKILDVTDSFNLTATKHGLGNSASTASRFKNFKLKTEAKIIYPTTLIASVDNMLVDYKHGTLFLSLDGGKSYTKSLSIPDVSIIKFIHLFSDGKIMFADHTKMYYSHDWQTYQESTLLNPDNTPFVSVVQYDNFTIYKNSSVKKIVDGVEMAVWGNYSSSGELDNSDFIKVWYTADKGLTVKKSFSFNTPTTPKCRHVHNIDFNPVDSTFWIQTGDASVNDVVMSHWVKGTYDIATDTWTWTVFASGDNFKSTNMIFWSDGYVYWSWDITPGGIVRAPYATLADIGTHELLFTTNKDCNNVFIGVNGDLVAFQTAWHGTEAARIMYYSPDRVTFYRIVGDVPSEFDDLTDAQYQAHWAPNASGKILCGVQSISQQPIGEWTRTPSIFVDDFIREYGFPNAFR